MNVQQLREWHAAKAAYQFLTQDPPPASLANAGPSFQQQVTALKALIDAVNARGTEQTASTRKARNVARNAAARQLRDGTLRSLRQVARVIAESPGGGALSPDFATIVEVPDTVNVQLIVQAARAAAQELAPYQALFVARGQAADFLTQLSAQTDALESLADDARQVRGTQVNATRDISRLLREIRNTLRCLGVEVRRLCDQDGARGKVTYATWQQLKRPHQASLSSDASDTTDHSTTPTPAGAAVPTPAGTVVQTATQAPATSTSAPVTTVTPTPAAV